MSFVTLKPRRSVPLRINSKSPQRHSFEEVSHRLVWMTGRYLGCQCAYRVKNMMKERWRQESLTVMFGRYDNAPAGLGLTVIPCWGFFYLQISLDGLWL